MLGLNSRFAFAAEDYSALTVTSQTNQKEAVPVSLQTYVAQDSGFAPWTLRRPQ